MDDFTAILANYNSEMRSNNDAEYIYSENEILKKIGKKSNMYDKIREEFPTIRKFLMVNYYCVYFDGVQKMIPKNTLCNICNKDFCFNSSITYNNRNIIHSRCQTILDNNKKREKMLKMFNDNNLCKI